MQALSDALPLSHVIGGLRDSWLGTTDDPRALWWTALVSLAAALFAVRAARKRIT
jgi:ABC-type polysaccharide/polyol phosphate export permease